MDCSKDRCRCSNALLSGLGVTVGLITRSDCYGTVAESGPDVAIENLTDVTVDWDHTTETSPDSVAAGVYSLCTSEDATSRRMVEPGPVLPLDVYMIGLLSTF